MSHRLLASASALALGLTAAHPAAAADVRIATEGAYPPYNTMDASGNLVGYEIDLANDLCRRMEAECEIIATDWDGIIPGLLAGRYDAIMAGMSITEERQETIAFSEPYALVPIVFSTMKDSEVANLSVPVDKLNFNELGSEGEAALSQMQEAMDGLTVAVQGATTHQYMLEEYFEDVEIRTYDTMENAALDLTSGRVDAFLTEQAFLNDFMASEQGADVVQVGPGMGGGPLGAGVGTGIRQDDEELVQKFNAAIEAATADGTIQRLGEQWFGIDVTPPTS